MTPPPEDQPPGSGGRRLPIPAWAIRAAVSAFCLIATGWWVATQPAPRIPTGADSLAFLSAAGLVTLINAVVRGYRWKAILRAVDLQPTGVEPYLLFAVGYMGNTVLPARGGDFMRIGLLSRKRQFDWKAVAGTLIPERLLDLIALALALILLSLSGSARSRLGSLPAVLSVVGLVVAAAALFGYHELRVRGHFQAIADRIRPFTRATRVLMSPLGVRLLGTSVALWASEALVLWLITSAVDERIPFFAAAFVVVLASFATAVPAAPGFIGTFDAAVIFGLQAAGVPAHATLALALLYRAVLFVPTTVIGAGILITRYGGLGALRGRLSRAPA